MQSDGADQKFTYGLKKTKFMIINPDLAHSVEELNECVELGVVQRAVEYAYMGLLVNEGGNLEDHLKEIETKAKEVARQISGIGSYFQVGEEYMRVRLDLFEKCFGPAISFGVHAWCISANEVSVLEKIQAKHLKRILNLPVSTSTAGVFMETGIWPRTERIEYMSLMYYHNLKNSEGRPASEMLTHNQLSQQNSLMTRVQRLATMFGIPLETAKGTKKSAWKKNVKEKLVTKIRTRLKQEITDRKKSRFLLQDEWGLKDYIKNLPGHISLDCIKIRLNMWKQKVNYKDGNLMCVKCKRMEDSSEHVLQCFSDIGKSELSNHSSSRWAEIVKVFQTYELELDKE